MALGQEELAKLIIKIQADVAGMRKELDKGKGQVSSFGNAIKKIIAGIGFAVVTKRIAGLVKESINLMDTMAKTSQKVGVATETLSGLKYAAQISGVQFGSLTTGLRLFAKNMYDASNGIGEAKDAFMDLNINVKNNDGTLKSVDQLLGEVADKMAGLESETQKTALAQRIFGRSGADMIPLLNQGSEGITKLMTEASKLGIIIDSNTARAAENLNDNLNALKQAVNGLFLALAKDLLPGLVETTNAMKEFVIEYRKLLGLPFKAIAKIAENFWEITAAVTALIAIKFGPAIAVWIMSLGSLKIALGGSVLALGAFKIALVALIGVKLGEWLGNLIDKLTYLATGIDISGMNKIKEMLADQKEEAEYLSQRMEKYNKVLADLGFTGPDAMKKFNAAVKAGTVVFDKASGKWIKLSKNIVTGTKDGVNVLDKLKSKIRELQLQFIAITDPARAAQMALEDFINETTSGHPERFAKTVDQLREAFKNLHDEQQKRALASVESEERLSEAMIKIKSAMQEVDQSYEAGLVSISNYYDKKRQLIEQSYQAEIQALKESSERNTDIVEQRKISIQIDEKVAESRREISKLNHEEAQSTRELLESIEHLREVKTSGMDADTNRITARFDAEMLELEERYSETIEKIKALDNEKLAAIEEGLTKEQILKDLMAAKDIQRAELVAKKELAIRQQHYRNMSELYGGMADIMGGLYEATGRETRTFFEMQKQFSIAQAFINAHEAATKAMAQGGIWGMVQAGIVYGQAIAHAMAIAQQKPKGYERGGRITEGSGVRDDVDIKAKKDEFIIPSESAKYYGFDKMEGLRKRLIPKSVFDSVSLFLTPRPIPATAMAAAGGMVTTNELTKNLSINIPVTIEDKNLARQLQTGIEKTVINILRANYR